MSVITDAVYNKLVNDTKLTGTFQNPGLISWLGTGSKYWDPVTRTWVTDARPAIFTYELKLEVLSSTEYSNVRGFIITTGHATDTSLSRSSSKTRKARDIQKDIRCYYREDTDPATKDDTFKEVENIAERVYEIFHNKPLTIPDPSDPTNYTKWQTVMVTCNGPIYIPAENEKLLSRNIDLMVVTLNFTIQEFR